MIFNYIHKANEEIKDFFSSDYDLSDIETLNKYRTYAFQIQAFSRLVRRSVKKSSEEFQHIRQLGETLKASSKFIEDCIGNYLFHDEMKEHSPRPSLLNEAKKLLEKNITNFQEHTQKINTALEELKEYDLVKIYLRGFIRELKKISEAIEQIDPELLEDGTHELRRKMRWVIMYVIYPKGLFKYKKSDVKTTKFTHLEFIPEFDPLEISFDVIHFLSESVFNLGQLKDKGLAQNYPPSEKDINQSTPEIIKATRDIIETLKTQKYLKTLRKELKTSLQD